MTQFNIGEWLNVKLANVNMRSELHGEELVRALDLAFSADVPNDFLDQVDSQLRGCFYTSHDKTDVIEGVKKITPNLIVRGLIDMPIKLSKFYEGYLLTIDHGLGEERGSNIKIGDCKVNELKADMKEGGTVTLKWRVQVSGVSRDIIGSCGELIQHEVKIKLEAPTLEQERASQPFKTSVKKDGKVVTNTPPPPDAGDIFAAQHGDKPAPKVTVKKTRRPAKGS